MLLPPTPPPDSFQRVADTLAAITALVGSLSTIYTLLVDLSRNRNRPKEHSLWKFFRVHHQPVDLQDWHSRNTIYLPLPIALLFSFPPYTLLLFFPFPPPSC